MKTNIINITLIFLVLFSTNFPQVVKPTNKITIDEARRIFVGQTVQIFGKTDSDGKLSGWNYADIKDGIYKRRPYRIWVGNKLESTNLPIGYRWQKAVIVAIELDEKSIPKTNALGEILDDKRSSPTFIYVFVKFRDGTIAASFNFLENLFDSDNSDSERFGDKTFLLVTELVQRSKFINSNIKSIIDKEVFAIATSKLYLINSTLEDLIDKKSRTSDFANLDPLTITVAKYNEKADVIILKLKSQNGREYLAYSSYEPRKILKGFLETVVFDPYLFTSLPPHTEKEIQAVRERKIFIGMSAQALEDSIGYPEKYDEYNSEKTEFIRSYFDGKLKVKINVQSRKVVDIQDKR